MQVPETLSRLLPLLAADPHDVYEWRLQSAWSRSAGTAARGSGGASVETLSPGDWNAGAGPDFKNAKIKINGKILTGDVEIHRRASDWFKHGHHLDPAYSSVILHAAEIDDTAEGPPAPAPLVMIHPAGNEDEPVTERGQIPGKCAAYFSAAAPENAAKFFRAAGLERFKEKSEALQRESIARGAGTACLRALFSASGNKNNKESFLELFGRLSKYERETLPQNLDAIVWGESGLLPDPSKFPSPPESAALVKDLWDKWWGLRRGSGPQIKWARSANRPVSSPERRVALLCALLGKTGMRPLAFFRETALKAASPRDFQRALYKALRQSDAFWDRHSSFTGRLARPAALAGEEKALELAVNVALPCLHALAQIEGDRRIGELAEETWMSLPRPESNITVKIASEKWFVPKTKARLALTDTASTQGVIHIHRSFCAKNSGDCNACALGRSLV